MAPASQSANGYKVQEKPGMIKVFSFKPDFGSTTMIGEPVCELKIRWTVHVRIVGAKFFPEHRIVDSSYESLFEFDKAIKK